MCKNIGIGNICKTVVLTFLEVPPVASSQLPVFSAVQHLGFSQHDYFRPMRHVKSTFIAWAFAS